jgi:hypothetical protein
VATNELHHPQADDGRRRRSRSAEEGRSKASRSEEEARWFLHQARQHSKTEARRAELILPPGVRGDAGIAAFLRRYETDPEFHAKIFAAVETALSKDREKVILDAQGKAYLIQTEDGLPANTAAAMLAEMRKIRTWEEIEQQALNEQERQEEEERTRICIWCGKVCESVEALATHEDDCA